MSLRRYTRETNAFSKRMWNHCCALGLFYFWYNFCRIHSSLGKTPAMAAGLTHEPWELEWLLDLMDEQVRMRPRGLYRSKHSMSREEGWNGCWQRGSCFQICQYIDS